MMNVMGYDAMALGSLDISLLTANELRQRIGEADFAVLSANAYISGTEELLADPYNLMEMGGHRVGILGLTDAAVSEDVLVSDPVQAAEKWLPRLGSSADIIIVLSQAGLEVEQEIAKRFPSIDIIVSGHNTPADDPMVAEGTGALMIRAEVPRPGNAGQVVGVAGLSFDETGRLLTHDWIRIVLDSRYVEDPAIKSWLQNIQ